MRGTLSTVQNTSSLVLRQIAAIRENVPLETVAAKATTLTPSGGGKAKGLCPLPDHQEKTPSFYVYPNDRWWCFGCGRGGDVVALYASVNDFGALREAVGYMALEYGVEIPRRPESWFRKQERQAPIRTKIEAAQIHLARRRLYRRFFKPVMEASTALSVEDRREDEQLLWELTLPIAEELVGMLEDA